MPEIKRPLRVFLYHVPADRVAVRDLYLRLINDGVDAWLVKEKILPGQDWKQEVQSAIREADVVLACISERFSQTDSRQKEVQVAFEAAIKGLNGKVVVIPVRLEECDWPENLRNWQWVDLFEEAGYEMLIWALQAEAEEIGAVIQAKESSLPRIISPRVNQEQPSSEENPVDTRQAILEAEGTGVLIEGPAVKLQGSASQSKLKRVVKIVLLGLVGSLVAVMLGSPRFQRLYQVALTTLNATPLPTPETKIRQVATSQPSPTPRPIPTLASKENISHIVFLVDTSGSMQGQRISRVKSALSKFVSRLSEEYLVSVIEFDKQVELRVAATRDHAAAAAVIKCINVETAHNGSCVVDALSAGVQQDRGAPVVNRPRTMIILLTDVELGENVGWNCSLRLTDDYVTLVWNHTIPIFSIYVGEDFDPNYFLRWMASEGATMAADSEKEIDGKLLSISEAAGLKLNAELSAPAPSTDIGELSMVFVTAGDFIMGNHTVSLDSFWIDKTEVTNAMYAECVQAGKCNPPRSNRSNTRERYYGNPAFDDYPVIYVPWLDANAYCAWVGGRLPTEAEWEKAARGIDGRSFPWGDPDPASVGDVANYHAQDTTQVGIYPSGASPYGALDMAGNVSEWVADWFSPEYYGNPPTINPVGPDSGEYRVWRGGSWANTSTDRLRTYSRTGNLPTDATGGIGFRCARSAGG